uniref:NB-ARC domain-containing protein n=1 Tax=Corethron hystrix TaxID=216773 RepID=A0A7S1BS42_9STRA|mmetsp:Transcript_3908/g.7441  ORF Transcript_3908/g.7441 Transcript_3908/m.7441 type:complete len:857 (+) Transcript_3908:330-2900(+)
MDGYKQRNIISTFYFIMSGYLPNALSDTHTSTDGNCGESPSAAITEGLQSKITSINRKRKHEMPRANRKKTEFANIPHEAKLSLMPSIDTNAAICSESFEHEVVETEMIDTALIPRMDVLKKIINNFVCFGDKECAETNNASCNHFLPKHRRLTLRGIGGVGKTTLAAMTISFTDVRSKFDHILWLNLGKYFNENPHQNNLSYEMYLDCLQILCRQLDVIAEFKPKDFLQPGDSSVIASAKILQGMEQSKIEMSQIIDGLNILIVLDDVWSHEDVEMFNFGEHMSSIFSILLTTRTLDEEPLAGSKLINVDLLNQDEACFLFYSEAGLVATTDQDAEAVGRIIKKCGNLPLAVRIAGRFLKTCRIIQPEKSLYTISEELIRKSCSPGMQPVYILLERSFSFVTDITASLALKFLFSAFTVVFHRDYILRPWVALDAVTLLWKALLRSADFSNLRQSLIRYRFTKLEDIADIMCVMGLLDRKYEKNQNQSKYQTYFRIHHDLMWDYGKMFSSKVSLVDGKVLGYDKNGIQYAENALVNCDDVLSLNTKQWNTSIVKKAQSNDKLLEKANLEPYLINWLPLHMVKAGLFDEVSDLLASEEFFESQMKMNGIEKGICFILSFVRSYNKSWNIGTFVSESPMTFVISVISAYVSRLNLCMEGHTPAKREIGKGLILLGIEHQKLSKWVKSLDLFSEALSIFKSIYNDDDHPDIIHVLKLIDSCALRHVVLVPRGSPHQLCLKNTDAIKSGSDNATLSLELSSHPGYGIVRCEEDSRLVIPAKGVSYQYNLLGVGLKESTIEVTCNSHSVQSISCGRSLFTAMAALDEGIPLILMTDLQFENNGENDDTSKILKAGSFFHI